MSVCSHIAGVTCDACRHLQSGGIAWSPDFGLPYPTAWAYEQACKALAAKHAELATLRAAAEKAWRALRVVKDGAEGTLKILESSPSAHTIDKGSAEWLRDTCAPAIAALDTALGGNASKKTKTIDTSAEHVDDVNGPPREEQSQDRAATASPELLGGKP